MDDHSRVRAMAVYHAKMGSVVRKSARVPNLPPLLCIKHSAVQNGNAFLTFLHILYQSAIDDKRCDFCLNSLIGISQKGGWSSPFDVFLKDIFFKFLRLCCLRISRAFLSFFFKQSVGIEVDPKTAIFGDE